MRESKELWSDEQVPNHRNWTNSKASRAILTAELMDVDEEGMTALACFLRDKLYSFVSDGAVIWASPLGA